jgi:GNAT superfamily N-acetyltransferase
MDGAEIRLEVVEGRPTYADQIARLRVDSWAPQAPSIRSLLPDGVWLDAHDEHATHVVVWHGDALIGAARVCRHEAITELHPQLAFDHQGPFAYISRLVVAPAFREHGVAAKVDSARDAVARNLEARWIVVCWSSLSGPPRLQRLLKQGFRLFSAVPDDFPFPSEEVQWLVKKVG